MLVASTILGRHIWAPSPCQGSTTILRWLCWSRITLQRSFYAKTKVRKNEYDNEEITSFLSDFLCIIVAVSYQHSYSRLRTWKKRIDANGLSAPYIQSLPTLYNTFMHVLLFFMLYTCRCSVYIEVQCTCVRKMYIVYMFCTCACTKSDTMHHYINFS